MESRKLSTRRSYNIGITWLNWLRWHLEWKDFSNAGIVELVSLLVGFLVRRNVSLGTLKVYMHGVRAHYLDDSMGAFNPCDAYRVQMCLRGAARILKDIPRQKLAWMVEFFPAILAAISKDFADVRDWAAFTVGFFGLFRKSELLAIKWRHIVEIPNGVKILVPISKTDPNSRGMWVFLSARVDMLCLVKAIRGLLSFWTSPEKADDHFVFLTARDTCVSKALSASAFVKRIKKWTKFLGLDPKEYSGHSLRRGGATALLRARASPEEVQIQGR